MSDRNEALRDLAAVRRDIDDLENEISTAEGAMPEDSGLAEGGTQNYRIVLKRLEAIRDKADHAAEKLRSALTELDS